MSDRKEAFDKIQRHFTSSNSIDVERATIKKLDWDLAKQYLISSAHDDDEPMAEVIPKVVGIEMAWVNPWNKSPVGTKLYTRPPSAVVPAALIREHERKSYHNGQTEIIKQLCDVINQMLEGNLQTRYGLPEPWKTTYERLSTFFRTTTDQRQVCAVVPEPFGTESAYQTAKDPILSSSNMIISCGLVRELVEALRNALSNASGGSLQDCCCGETEQAWRLCPLHSAPPKQEQGQ